jgi:hypothetical protein
MQEVSRNTVITIILGRRIVGRSIDQFLMRRRWRKRRISREWHLPRNPGRTIGCGCCMLWILLAAGTIITPVIIQQFVVAMRRRKWREKID